MALRLMQIYLPHGSDQKPDELLEDRAILWRSRDVDTDQVVLQLLVAAEETEPIMDQFEQHYANVEGFHVVLFPVEAVVPRPKAPPPKESEPTEPEEPEPPKPQLRVSREELYNDAAEGIGINRVFMAMTVLSAIVAAIGLARNDVAVIIGAMVIAPLLGPNVAIAFATTLGDAALWRRALATNLAGVTAALAVAVLVGIVFQIDVASPAIVARTNVGLGDLALAFAAGMAGTLAFTNGLKGSVIGVMVAVALVPPLVVGGMLFGAGHYEGAFGAFLLTAANVVCINLAGVLTFLAQGIRPRSWWQAEYVRRKVRIAVMFWISLVLLLVLILWLRTKVDVPSM